VLLVGASEEEPNTHAQLVSMMAEQLDAMDAGQVRDGQAAGPSCGRTALVSRMPEQQDAMQDAGAVRDEGAAGCWTKLCAKTGASLPAKGTSIEVQWSVRDENYLKWFTAVVVKPS
jgi:hypothetical protein